MYSIIKRIINKCSRKYWQLRFKLHKGKKLKNIIVFESAPDLEDNSRQVFDEMIRNKVNKRYKLVFLLFKSDDVVHSGIKNVYILPHWHPRAKVYCKTAKAIVCCNRFIEKADQRQFCIYLSHGTGLKDSRAYFRVPDWIDYVVAASPCLEERHAAELVYDRSKTIGLGFPRNDILLDSQVPIKAALKTMCSKVIAWYPTFRQHPYLKYTQIHNPIPLLDDIDCAQKLNEAAKVADVLIVIKPHFAQDIQYIREMNLSNIRFIDDSFFKENNILSYEFVGACDALVTDYSSIYFDYTVCDKPIAGVWSDIEEYKTNPGLVENYEELCKGMEKIYTLEELTAFIQRVGNGVDLLQAERREIRDYTNCPANESNTKRVTDFIMKKIDGGK